MQYVTYDPSGNLTGAFWQDLIPAHAANHIEVTAQQYAQWVTFKANAGRDGVEVAPPTMPTVAGYTAAIQTMLDAEARTHNYDSILSLASYAASTHPPFAAEGQAGLDWRDAVWGASYALMAQVQAGTLAQPTIAELLAMLPPMVWPV